MYIHTKNGTTAAGRAGQEVKYERIGEKGTPKATFSIAATQVDSNEVKWFNCQARGDLAEHVKALNIAKGDRLLVVGIIKEHEYNGKIYHNLVVDWVDRLAVGRAAEISLREVATHEVEDEEDLPF